MVQPSLNRQISLNSRPTWRSARPSS